MKLKILMLSIILLILAGCRTRSVHKVKEKEQVTEMVQNETKTETKNEKVEEKKEIKKSEISEKKKESRTETEIEGKTELLIKNRIIDRKDEKILKQDELIQYADSTVAKVKEQLNIEK